MAELHPTIEDKVDYLYQRAMITDVVSRFFFSLDRKSWDEAASCLTDPISFGVPGGNLDDPAVSGAPVARADLMAGVEARNGGFHQTIHMHPNPVVSIDGDCARYESYQAAPHSLGPTAEDTFCTWGFYDVALRRIGGEWKIERMTVDVRLSTGGDMAENFRRALERGTRLMTGGAK
ncbi:nuclear transport factor 2 family protein [Sphingobium sp. DC-2]|uniref:nuclear transport factor 2 family protein n=1 Tax=Sphingobium sp. DC-2 TaxID=1303256 RepID=UPI0004C4002A|nr:nuclear transport factor 2 family protein [Sphingobium sp. DC-2]